MFRRSLPISVPRLPSAPLERFRAAALAVALIGLVLAVPAILGAPGVPALLRAGALLAAIALAGHWLRGFRRGGFLAKTEPVEALAVFAVMAIAHGDPVLPLFALMFRSLYGSAAWAIARAGLFVLVLVGAELVQDAGDVAGEQGRALGLIVAVAMMQGLRVASESHARSEQLLRAVVEQSPDVAAIVGEDLRVRWIGAAPNGLFGDRGEHLIGRHVLEVVHPDDVAGVEALFAHLAARPGARRTQPLQLIDPVGEHHAVEATVANRLDDPQLRGFLVNIHDVTERQRLEHERLELVQLRERVDAERERHELEARLQRSERLGSVGQLAGGVAHDFNNLLGIIINYAGFVREGLPPGEELREDLDEIEAAAERGAALTRQLLVFSRRRPSQPEVVDVNAVVDGLERLLSTSVGGHVALRREHEAELWSVHADPGTIEQIVVNLVINARDALSAGGTICTITENAELDAAAAAAIELTPGRYVRLAVRDDGCGMDEETQRRAVEPFFTTKPSGQGTGLGLATAFGTAHAAGGTVTIDSAPGAGTTVSVYLPSIDACALPVAATAAPDARGSRGQRILVVDDEPSGRALVERLLRDEGYAVVSSACAEDALAEVARAGAPFDLVVTDVVMPGLSGVELVARLRERTPDQRVLLMSGYSDELVQRRGAGSVPDRLLHKPFNAAALRLAVREMLPATAPAGVAA